MVHFLIALVCLLPKLGYRVVVKRGSSDSKEALSWACCQVKLSEAREGWWDVVELPSSQDGSKERVDAVGVPRGLRRSVCSRRLLSLGFFLSTQEPQKQAPLEE